MTILSCHSNESACATAKKKKPTVFIETNVINIFSKFQVHPLIASEEIFLYCFANLAFWLAWQPLKFKGFDKIHICGRGLLKEHFFNFCQNICIEIEIKAYFPFSHYKSMKTLLP